jgi:short subunit dehydrogenase-like uncharacterized protein
MFEPPLLRSRGAASIAVSPPTVTEIDDATTAAVVGAPAGGYYTPSMLIGARCVEELPGSTPIRVN